MKTVQANFMNHVIILIVYLLILDKKTSKVLSKYNLFFDNTDAEWQIIEPGQKILKK